MIRVLFLPSNINMPKFSKTCQNPLHDDRLKDFHNERQMNWAFNNFHFQITWVPEREERGNVRCQSKEPIFHFFNPFLETLVSKVAF